MSIQSLKGTTRTIANILNTVILEEIPETNDELFCVVLPVLQIPQTPPSGLNDCVIMSLEYDVMVRFCRLVKLDIYNYRIQTCI